MKEPWRLSTSIVGPVAGAFAAATMIGAVISGPGAVRALRLLGGGIGVAALPLAFIPFLTLRRHGRTRTGATYMNTTVVVDRGPFGLVRHPQYLAYILFAVAFGLLAQRMFVTMLAAVAVVLLHLTAVLEEAECAERLGGDYVGYARRVPRYNLLVGVARALRRRRSK